MPLFKKRPQTFNVQIQDILLRELNGIGVDYTTRVSESTLARVHFIVRTDPTNPPEHIASTLDLYAAALLRVLDPDATTGDPCKTSL